MSKPMWCRWCEEGNTPQLLDIDGVRQSVSGSEVACWGHAYEDAWWPCERKTADEHGIIADLLETCKAVLDGLQRATVRTSDGSNDRCISQAVALELQRMLLDAVAKTEGSGS